MAPVSSPALSLDQLADGRRDPVLVVDFVQFSTARQLSEELAEHGGGHPVHRIDPITDLAREPGYRPFAALVDGYAGLCRERGLAAGRLAVVGQCSAAPLATALAARLAGPARVRTVLVQPSWPDPAMVAGDFRTFRAELGADPGPAPEPGADPELALRQMVALLGEDLRAMAVRHELDPAGAALADMLARYRAWLGFLLASSTGPRADRPAAGGAGAGGSGAGASGAGGSGAGGSGADRPVVVPDDDGAGGTLAERVLARAWPADDTSS